MINITDKLSIEQIELAEHWLGQQNSDDTALMIEKYEMHLDIGDTEDALTNLYTFLSDVLDEIKKQ